jgi:ABC-2 type transport system ATP-binding protein
MPELLEPADARGGNRQVETRIEDRGPQIEDWKARGPDAQTTLVPSILRFDHVSKWYGPVIGVNQVTLELHPGITGLVGSNGAGKSTLMRLAAGQLRPEIGSVRVCDREAWSAAAKRHIGYCPDVDRFYEEMSGRRFVEIMARFSGYTAPQARDRAGAVLELVGMAKRCDRPLGGYSKGMRQRIKLAQALVHDPQLLLLDEPLSGIDPIGRREFVDVLLRLGGQGKCLLVSSHELEELEKLTDRVAIVARGRIAAVGTQTQIRDLLNDHPLAIRLSCDRDRDLALSIMRLDEVVGIDLEGTDGLVVRARNARRFFEQLTTLVLEEDFDMRHIETLDESTHSLLEYLLK